MNNIPFFEVNGQKYEIKRNRFLQAEFNKLKGDLEMSEDEQVAYVKEEDFNDKIQKLSERKSQLYDKYLETFSEEDEELYNKACIAYDKLVEQSKSLESVSAKQRKKTIDMGEKLIIIALQYNNKGETIRTEKEATDIWCSYADEYGEIAIMEFIAFTLNYLLGVDDEEENPFVTQAKAKAEQKANMQKGLKKVK